MKKGGKNEKTEKLGSYTANMRRKNANKHIWLNIGSGDIDLNYAVAGYDMSTGESIYDYDLLSALLLSYGYSAGISAMFIEEFMATGTKNGNRNIVISSAAKANIFRNVRSLPDNPSAGNNYKSK